MKRRVLVQYMVDEWVSNSFFVRTLVIDTVSTGAMP